MTERDAAAVTAFWRDLGLPGLIDVHTHFMPERVMRKVWAYFDAAGPILGRPWPITYRGDDDTRVTLLREFGVRAFSSLVYPHKPGMAAWLNDWAAEFAADTPDCLPTATFYPEPDAAGYVRAAIARGTRVFKAHIQVGDYDPTDPLLDDVWGALADAQIPTVIHCGSGPAPGRFTGPTPIEQVLQRHPQLPLIIAHMGGPEYSAFLDLVERHPRVDLDTTMVFTEFNERIMRFPRSEMPRVRDLGDRILFGSDFPNIPYPYLHALEALRDLELGDDWLRAVCYGNAARLFCVQTSE
ncbi:MAG TPA: amidohydrolase family protein [Aldersonia sp.]